MVVKTEVCAFSEQKIYPGRGIRCITRDGKLAVLLNTKCQAFFSRKTKSQVIRWTVTWRRLNKKLKTDDASKKKRKRQRRVIRDVIGLEREVIRRQRNLTNDERDAQREQAIREIKERKEKAKKTKPATNVAKAQPVQKPAAKSGKK